MAVHYHIDEGQAAVVDGPANIIIKTGKEPIIGTPVRKIEMKEENDKEASQSKKS